MEYPLREQTLTTENEAPPCPSPSLPPLEKAMLRDDNSWLKTFSDLRYGIFPAKKPEEVMAYQGLAEYGLEVDPEMARRYHLCLEDQKVQYIRQKLEEKQAEILRQRREAEQEAAWQHSRQREILAQQQFAWYSKQNPRYAQSARHEDFFRETAAFAVAGGESDDTESEQAMQLDDSIMSSPTYRYAAQNDAVQDSSFTIPYFARTVDSTAEAEEYLSVEARTRKRRNLYNPSQPPHRMMNWAERDYSGLLQTPPPGFTPTASIGEADLHRDMVHDTQLAKQLEPHRIVQDEPTPPYHPDDEMLLQDSGEQVAQRVKSPTLSDLIGSETPSEEDDASADGDSDFDPRSRSSQPPTHRDVKGFGGRKRRASGRSTGRASRRARR
ncbi:uncharacterized protein Z520_04363 [Fonsecaea multimorphosa CBS 102226]|uniref:Uncharacterized protein n=1 Tax=Fonsecaea multimorphosa CBS 102226 TaxID=1442371 RepID=A0A0D2K1J1_9EURO|nr:uncharacterized protein Z520_04363 [Fonsecaea multimorphosa CBS 102226]KIX99727.1 hypothetical protein Z520_04363 [Fonsecaea multimorphosa CBS 102226]OAL26775.1 hypothetical protein AYO22_04128 [Fonsecaea multimorphosa]